MAGMTIGKLALEAGVHVETVRYYERRKLLVRPPDRASGYRIYSGDVVRRIRFIKRAQQLGFSLNEIRDLLWLKAAPRKRCDQVQKKAMEKIREIEDKVRSLNSMQAALGNLIRECSGKAGVTDCPILNALDTEGER